MAFQLYNFVSAETRGIEEVAKAVVEANYWAEEARKAGWEVSFGTTDDGIDVTLGLSRSDFPSPVDEAEV